MDTFKENLTQGALLRELENHLIDIKPTNNNVVNNATSYIKLDDQERWLHYQAFNELHAKGCPGLPTFYPPLGFDSDDHKVLQATLLEGLTGEDEDILASISRLQRFKPKNKRYLAYEILGEAETSDSFPIFAVLGELDLTHQAMRYQVKLKGLEQSFNLSAAQLGLDPVEPHGPLRYQEFSTYNIKLDRIRM